MSGEIKSTKRRPVVVTTLAVIVLGMAFGFLGCGRPPQMGADEQVFRTVDALFTAVTARDEKGQEVEYYRYDRLQYPVRLDNDDFDPDKVWGKPGGGRTARP